MFHEDQQIGQIPKSQRNARQVERSPRTADTKKSAPRFKASNKIGSCGLKEPPQFSPESAVNGVVPATQSALLAPRLPVKSTSPGTRVPHLNVGWAAAQPDDEPSAHAPEESGPAGRLRSQIRDDVCLVVEEAVKRLERSHWEQMSSLSSRLLDIQKALRGGQPQGVPLEADLLPEPADKPVALVTPGSNEGEADENGCREKKNGYLEKSVLQQGDVADPDQKPPRRKNSATEGILESTSKRLDGQDHPMDAVGLQSAIDALMMIMQPDTDSKPNLLQRGMTTAFRTWRSFMSGEQVEHTCWLDRAVHSSAFEHICAFIISMNAVFIWISTNYELQNPGQVSSVLQYIEYLFIGWYCIELLLKMISQGRHFWMGPEHSWNIFDFFLVVFSAAQLVLEKSSVNISFARTVRLFKISRAFRLFRFLEFMKDVKMMIYVMIHSLFAVFWGLVLIVFFLFLFAIIILQAVILYLDLHKANPDQQYQDVQDMFSSVEHTMLLFFQTVSSGREWRQPYDVLSETGSWWAQLVYLLFISFFTIAIWNIVTSIFIEKAIAMAEPDKELVMLRKRREMMQDVEQLREILDKLDVDHSNSLSPKEFQKICQVPEFRHFLDSRGIHIKDAGTFFALIAQSVGSTAEVEIDTMIACCMHIKGWATSIDLHTLRFEVKAALAEQRQLLKRLSEQPPRK